MTFESISGPREVDSNSTESLDGSERAAALRSRGLLWGAMPLQLRIDASDPQVIEAQMDIFNQLLQRIADSRPEGVPDNLAEFVEQSFMSRYTSHDILNRIAYDQRLKADYPEEDFARHSNAFDGIAVVDELLTARAEMGMASIELARVTHPYGSNVDSVYGMRREVEDHVVANHGEIIRTPKSDIEYKLRDHDFFDDRPVEERSRLGLLFTRKQTVGMMPDGTRILERTSFVVRLDNDQFDKRLKKLPIDEIRQRLSEDSKYWSRFIEPIVSQMEQDDFRFIIPLSTTVYAYNHEVQELIKLRDQKSL